MDTGVDRSRSPLTRLAKLRYGLLLVPLVFLVVFFFYPLISILAVSLAPDGQLDLGAFTALITSSYYRDTLVFTAGQAFLSTLLTVALALPGAYIFVRYQFPGKSLLMALATLPFVLPTVVVATAFSALIGPRGLVNTGLMSLFVLKTPPVQLERTLAIILIVHVFYNYAVALRLISGYWANQNPRMEEAARVLGADGWRLWWTIRLPLLRPAVLAASALVFIFTFTSFGVVLILGGPRFATLEVEIYRQATGLFNLPVAGALALVQIILMFALMAVYTRLQKQITTDIQRAERVALPPRSRGAKLAIGVNLSAMVILLFAPLLALVIRSFTAGNSGWTLDYYQQLTVNTRQSLLFVPPVQAISNSLVFAILTTLLALFLGLITAYLLSRRNLPLARWLDPLFMLPLAASAVTLGFGFIIALDKPPLNLRTSPLLIPIAHTLVAMPFVVRSVLPALRGIPPSVQEAAGVLGASPWRVWRWIDLPLISRGLVVGATFAFTVSMGEFGASLFVARPDTPTIPVAIFRLLGQPGASNYGQALALSVILMLVSALGFVLIERLRTAGIGEF
ncbi:MAG: iron ABC transporter permease [Anaerolineaceae bacterium]|nr:iron ABC transporter permease [Anaerolineaceae bacterium]